MARPDQEAIETFMSITGVSEAAAIHKLEEHRGDLNQAVNAHFSEGVRNITQEASFTAPQDVVMDVDDPLPVESQRPPSSLFPFTRDLNHPFSHLDPNLTRGIFDSSNAATTQSPFVSRPRNVREIPIEVKDGIGASPPTIEDVTDTVLGHGPETHDTPIIVDDDAQSFPNPPIRDASGPTAPTIEDEPDNDIEEEMIRAAIEASRHESAMPNQDYGDNLDLSDPNSQPQQSHLGDPDIAHAVSLSLQTAEQEKALRELEGGVGASEVGQRSGVPEEMVKVPSNARQSRMEVGSSSVQDEAEEDVEDWPPNRRRRVSSGSIDVAENNEEVHLIPPSSPRQHENVPHSQQNNRSDFPPDELGGIISSAEHDEAVMLEAAMFGGIPEEEVRYRFPHHAPHHPIMHNGLGPLPPWGTPRPPSPSLTAQRLIREQQDDEYLAALEADRQKEIKAKEEAEAALAEEKRKEEELHRKLQEEQETERQLAAKEASLPQEPAADDESAITLLVRMPDGSRRGRRFLKSDNLQCLFDFIDVGRVVKPGSYRLVRPYPRRAFSDGESASTFNELGLTSKQEALYLELI